MASPSGYEGGGEAVGGKSRRRPFRRAAAAATPYARPPEAVRGLRAAAAGRGSGGGGWLSKLVDPASRMITGGATRLFSFLSNRMLSVPALPPAPPPVAGEVPMEATIQCNEQALNAGENVHLPNVTSEVLEEQGNIPGNKPLNKLETVGISDVEQLLKQKTFTRDESEHLTELLRSRTVGPSSFMPVANNSVKDMRTLNISFEDGKGGSFLTPRNISLPIPMEDTSSPTEIAKAYMGSRPSKVPPSSLIHSSQFSQEETTRNFPFARKESFSRTPLTHNFGPSGSFENGYLTPRTKGRSAMYKMARSPYFKDQHTPSGKIEMPSRDGSAGTSSTLQWASRTVTESDGKQSSKRRSAVLDNEIGPGPIRRVRQKYNLVYPIKDEKHSLSVPLQSTETARKILQRFDELLPSPEEKKLELKNTERNESYKLSVDSLSGWALNNPKDIDSPKFFDVGNSGNEETHDESVVQNALKKPDKLEDNRNSLVPVSGIIIASKRDIPLNPSTSGYASKSVGKTEPPVILSSEVSSLGKNPAFRISALEDSDMDDDDNIVKDVSGPSTEGKFGSGILKGNNIRDTISQNTELQMSNLSPASSPSMPKTDTESMVGPLDNTSDFTFCDASSHFTNLAPPTPTLAKQSQQKELVAIPLFSFGSKGDSVVKFSSTPTSVSKSHGLKISGRILEDSSADDNVGKTPNPVDATQSVEAAVSSGKTATIPAPVFSSMTSSTPNFHNGSPSALASASSASVSPSTESSDMKTGLNFSRGNVTTASSLLTIPSPASISSTCNFQIETGPSSEVSMPPSASVEESESKNSQSLFSQWKSNFTTSNKISPTAAKTDAASFPSLKTSSGVATPYLSSGSGNASGHSSFPLSSTTANGSFIPISSSVFSVPVSASCSLFSSVGISSPALASSSFPRPTFGSDMIDTSLQNNSPHKHVRFAAMPSSLTAVVSGSQPSTGSGVPSFLEGSGQRCPSSSTAFGLNGSTPAFCSSSFVSTTGIGTSSSSHTWPPSSNIHSESSTGSSLGLTSAGGMFSSGSQASALPMGFGFLSSGSGSSLAFGSSLPSSPLPFGSASVSTSPLSSGSALSPQTPGIWRSFNPTGFVSGSQGNEQMNVEDSMADDNTQALTPTVPAAFGQPVNSVMSNFAFSPPAQESFQFGQQNSPMPQPTPPFQAGGSLDFTGGSFSLGSGGDKSGRKYIRVKRDRNRKK